MWARRLRAARAAYSNNVVALVRADLTVIGQVSAFLRCRLICAEALAENVTREELAPADRAAAVKKLRDETGWSYSVIAEQLGTSHASLMRLAAIASSEVVQHALATGQVQQQQAAIVARAARSDAEAVELIGRVRGKTTEQTRKLVRAVVNKPVARKLRVVPDGCVDMTTLPIYLLCQRRIVARDEVHAALTASVTVVG